MNTTIIAAVQFDWVIHLPMFVLILLAGALAFAVLRITRRAPRTAPATPSPPAPETRRPEAITLLLVGLSTLFLCLVSTHTGGYLLIPSAVVPGHATIYWLLAAAATTLVFIFARLAHRGRTPLAVIAVGITLASYGMVLNSTHGFFLGKTRHGFQPPGKHLLIIHLQDQQNDRADIEGADIWIAGKNVGKSPVTMTMAEFYQLVPESMPEPADYNDQSAQIIIPKHELLETWGSGFRPWLKFKTHVNTGARERVWITAYAKISWNGETGYAVGGSHGGGGGAVYRSHIPVIFPERHAFIKHHLDVARANDYQIDGAWITKMKSIGASAIAAVRTAAKREPPFSAILDRLESTGIPLPPLGPETPPADIWHTFESIMQQADAAGEYNTDSALGRLTEKIASHLDLEVLASLAESILKAKSWNYQISWQTRDGIQHFTGKLPPNSSDYARRNYLPPHAYAVAHAVWVADRSLSDTHDNPLEKIVTPALLRWQHGREIAVDAAARLGGSAYDTYLERHDWKHEYELGDDQYYFKTAQLAVGIRSNRWLVARLLQPGLEGAKFRSENRESLFGLLHEILAKNQDQPRHELLDALFFDPELAREYWHEYRSNTPKWFDANVPAHLFWYLSRMDAPTGEFTKTFRELALQDDGDTYASWLNSALKELRILPAAKRTTVLNALLDTCAEIAEKLPRSHPFRSRFTASIPDAIRTMLFIEGDPAAVGLYLTDVSGDRLTLLSNWLQHTRPDHPIVDRLAKHETPALRAIVAGVAAEHPTPHLRQLLTDLLDDSDATVQNAAIAADQKIAGLRTQP